MRTGTYVEVHPDELQMPERCASCDGPSHTRVLARRSLGIGKPALLSVPYCEQCRRLASRSLRTFWVLGVGITAACGAALLATVALAGFSPWISTPAALVVATVVIVLVAVGASLLPPRKPATAHQLAVEIARANDKRLRLFCSNDSWAQEMARLSAGRTRPGRRVFRLMPEGALLSVGLGGALVGSLGGFRLMHCPVAVDNPTNEAMQIYLDEAPAMVVPPNPRGTAPPEMWVGLGEHILAYGPVGASRPVSAVRVTTTRAHSLYVPRQAACYWKIVTVYGNANPGAAGSEALYGREFHELGYVDDWFESSPKQVSSDSGGAQRTSLVRNSACTALALNGCDAKVLGQLTRCQDSAESASEYDDCLRAAKTRCEDKR